MVPFIAFKSDWFCSTFLVFTELGLPGGKAHCLPLFFTTGNGSGPLRNSSKRALTTTAEEVRENILKIGGRSSRTSIQNTVVAALKSSGPESETESASDAANRIIMMNFNGLQQWNSKSASLKELFSLATIMDQGPVAITAAYQVLKQHLENPYQPVVESPLMP